MATKNFNPLTDAMQALQFLMINSPRETMQQSLRAMAVVKNKLELYTKVASELAVLRDQNTILQEQISTLRAEISAYQFRDTFVEPVPKKENITPPLIEEISSEQKRKGRPRGS